MLVAAAVLPHPPLLVPEVAAGAAAELSDLRAACGEALASVQQAMGPGGDVVVVGAGARRQTFRPGAVGSLAGFGVPLDVALPGRVASDTSASPTLPLSLTVGAWLMEETGGWDAPGVTVRAESVPRDLASTDAVALGAQWATSADRLVLVVMGDGANALSTRAPGYLVPGAEEWQSVATAALGSADVDVLAKLQVDDAARFGAVGRVPWQVLAGAASAPVHAKLLAMDDRYGVAYVVAQWLATGATG